MSPVEFGFYSLGLVVVLIAIRVPIGVAVGLVGFLGVVALRNVNVAFGLLKTIPFELAANWSLSAIPMFLVMGAVAHQTGISEALFRAARLWLSRLPGGLAVAANFACAGFAAASGSSVATAAAMGRLAIPEMLRHGYDRGLATGVVASAGTLGSMIPPSILFVLYGVFAEVSITKLLIAGILPGLLTAAIYAVMIVTRCTLSPGLAPSVHEETPWRERMTALLSVWPLLAIIIGIIGGLYSGLTTPTEAGAFGALLTLVVALLQGRLTLRILWTSALESVINTSRIFFIAFNAIILTKFLALTGLPIFLGAQIGDWALDPLLLVIATSIIYIVLGMFLDPLGLMLITLPVLLPMFEALHLDLIWLGVLVVKYLEIGLITPPVGFNVHVIKGVMGDEVELEEIFKGVTWFLLCEAIVLVLLVAFPQISLFLPNLSG